MEGCGCGVLRVVVSPIVIVYLFLTLGASEDVDSIFPACKEKTNAINIPNLIDPNPCVFRCPTKVEMVCANDGTSHINECFLCKDACNRKDMPIFKVCNGRCPCKGKPHDDVMRTVEDCKDGKCAVDASDHYDADYGQDVEAPEAKYTYPEYTREQDENGELIHELEGYSEKGDGGDDPWAVLFEGEEGEAEWIYDDDEEEGEDFEDGGYAEDEGEGQDEGEEELYEEGDEEVQGEGQDEGEEEREEEGDEEVQGEDKLQGEGEVQSEDKLQWEGEVQSEDKVQGDGKESVGAGEKEGEEVTVEKKQNDGDDQETNKNEPQEGSKEEQKAGEEEHKKDEPIKVVIPKVENKEDISS